MTGLISRRSALGRLGIVLSATAIPASTLHAASEPVAETRYGKVRGTLVDGVYTFKGIRYGATTAGENRFMPPRPPQPWSGEADATKFGNSAPQSNPVPPPPGTPSPIILTQLTPPPGVSPPHRERPAESEDCLFLNVWTAGLRDGRRRPVMFWLHPGFFASGSGSTVDGSHLARSGDVVVVSINHRINIFGFSHLAELGGAAFAQSGNAGMLDVIAALEWVRDNIERFGGDPSRVMVFGESGGGMKTSFLMASPRARGLLHRASVLSGPGLRMIERERAARVSEAVLRELQLGPKAVRELQQVAVGKLLAAYFAVKNKVFPDRYFTDLECFAPVVDGDVLPRHPFDPDAPALAARIPLLIGWNRTEMTFFMGADAEGFTLDEAALRRRASGFLGDRAEAALALYARRYPGTSASQRYIQLWSDFSIMAATLEQAERKAAQAGAPTFVYRFDWPTPVLGGKLGSPHSLESSFVWNDPAGGALLTGGGAKVTQLAAQVSAAWKSFAITGEPASGAGSLPAWPAYDLKARQTMLIDEHSRVVSDPTREERLLLAGK